jgi:hypothetical protein
MRVVWRACRAASRVSSRIFPLAGPMALIAVIGTWAGLLIVGWALIFWPQIDNGFRFESGAGDTGSDFVEALHVSLASLTTVGSGDVSPDDAWLRIATPLEALLGFGLLSASISWLLLIYPVLVRRRSLAYEIAIMRKAEEDTGVEADDLEPPAAEDLYAELTSRLIAVERDLVNFPISYYFAERDERFSLPTIAGYLLELAERGASDDAPDRVRLRAAMLLEALGDLATTTSTHLRGSFDSTKDALAAYANDHLRAQPSDRTTPPAMGGD